MTEQTNDVPAPFDLAALDVATGADKGSDMPLLGADGEPARLPGGAPLFITVLGYYSAAAVAARRSIEQRRTKQALKSRKAEYTAEQREADELDLLVACTTGWNIPALDGQPFPFSPENARKLYSDRRFRKIRDAVNAHIGDEANFTKPR